MHRYGQYCPVARAAEVLADRWTVLIVRELLADINHFNELERGLPHMSRALLAERLRRLEHSGVLERRALSRGKHTEYRLTPAGRELQRLIDLLGEWGARWAFGDPRPKARSDYPSVVDAQTGGNRLNSAAPHCDRVRLPRRTEAKILAADRTG
jgi:DNA-binding HxlR family transcriptional regulator